MNGKLVCALLLQLCWWSGPAMATVSISSIGTQGAGDSEDNPAEVGETVTLRCDFSLSSDDSLTNCQWNHVVDDDYLTDETADLANVEIKCAGNQGDSGCSTGQAIDSSYASRLDLSISSSSCGLNIRDPQPEDNGEWSCHVFGLDDNGSTKSMDLYVSQLAEVEITDPDERSGESIEFNIDDEDDEIEVTCTAYGGLPTPEFHWYVDDDDHELRSSDFDYVEREGYDRETGMNTIEHTMTWRPTAEDLCEEYELNADICEDDGDRYDNDDYKTFSFDLICRVEQEGLTDSDSLGSNSYNSGQTAEIRIEVSAANDVRVMAAMVTLAAAVAKWAS